MCRHENYPTNEKFNQKKEVRLTALPFSITLSLLTNQ